MDAFLKGQTRSKPAVGEKGSSSKAESKGERRAIPWVEKYRPRTVDDVAQQEEVVAVLSKCLQGADLPNLLFYGPPGTGKTSAILAVARQLFGPELMRSRVLELNASDERGIQVVREKVKGFAQQAVSSVRPDGKACPSFKIVILDEADSMTTSAQAALRRTMEKASRTTRFCLICNYISRIIEPLTSRCSKFRFQPLSEAVLLSRLEHIAGEEGVQCPPEAVAEMVRVSEGDLRKAITILQSATRLTGGEMSVADVCEIAGVLPSDRIDSLMTACHSNSYDVLEECVRCLMAEGFSCSQTLSQLHDRIVSLSDITDQQKSRVCKAMGLTDRHLMDGADEFLQLMHLCSVVMETLCHRQ